MLGDLGTLAGVVATDPLTCALVVGTAGVILYSILTRPTKALSNLPVRSAVFVSPDGTRTERFAVEVVRRPRDQRVGMMFRTAIAPGTGMAFVWRRPMRTAIWMRRTFVALDVVFVSRSGRVMEVVTRQPNGWRLSGWRRKSAMVVELPAGTCSAKGVGVSWIATLA